MSCHAAVSVAIPAPRLTRSDSDRSKTITSWPTRCRSAAVAHPAIDPPMMPTLMPVTPASSRKSSAGAGGEGVEVGGDGVAGEVLDSLGEVARLGGASEDRGGQLGPHQAEADRDVADALRGREGEYGS